MHVLAQSENYGGAILWSLVILLLCVALFFLVSMVRKKVRGDADEGPITGFTLADLRELHRSGKMSADEFERAKAKILDATKAAATKPPPQQADAPRRRYNPPTS